MHNSIELLREIKKKRIILKLYNQINSHSPSNSISKLLLKYIDTDKKIIILNKHRRMGGTSLLLTLYYYFLRHHKYSQYYCTKYRRIQSEMYVNYVNFNDLHNISTSDIYNKRALFIDEVNYLTEFDSNNIEKTINELINIDFDKIFIVSSSLNKKTISPIIKEKDNIIEYDELFK